MAGKGDKKMNRRANNQPVSQETGEPFKIELWAKKEEKKVPVDLFDTKAEEFARFVKEDDRGKNKKTQIRKYYDELYSFYSRLKGSKDRDKEFQDLLPLIRMIKAKLAYAEGRGHISPGFRASVAYIINQIDSYDSLEVAVRFMEAFLGYYTALQKG